MNTRPVADSTSRLWAGTSGGINIKRSIMQVKNLLAERYGESDLALVDAVRKTDVERICRDISETCLRHGINLELKSAWLLDGTVKVTVSTSYMTGPGYYV